MQLEPQSHPRSQNGEKQKTKQIFIIQREHAIYRTSNSFPKGGLLARHIEGENGTETDTQTT